MSKRNINKTLLARQTVTVGDTNTAPLYIGNNTGVAVHIIWEGSPVTDVRFQTSNDIRIERRPDDAAWFTESITTASGIDGNVADGNLMCHIDNVNSAYLRVQLATTTAGTFSVYGTSKE